MTRKVDLALSIPTACREGIKLLHLLQVDPVENNVKKHANYEQIEVRLPPEYKSDIHAC